MPLDGRFGLHRPMVVGPGVATNSGFGKLPNTNPTFELFVTHVQEDGPLMKIWAQNDRMAAMFVETLIRSYKPAFDGLVGQPKTAHELSIGLLCCAKFEDYVYYRARIVDFTRPDKVSVVFVDYGNTAVISVENIRLLDNLGPDLALVSIHDLASEYLLGCIVPRKAEWEDQAVEFIKQKLCYNELQCQTIFEAYGTKFIRILLNGVDFTHVLIKNNLGFPLPIQAHEVLVSGIYGKHIAPERFNIPPPPMPRVLTPIQTHHEPSTSFSAAQPRFLSEMLLPGSEHLVYVSHVEDGPFSFAIQLKSVAEKALTKLMAELNDHELKPISGPLIPGSVCLGRFSEDQSLCRAIVMNVLDDKCKLYYADYGNSEILPYSEIFEVPPQYVGLKVMALRFTLANIRGQVFSDNVKAFFKQQVTDKQVVIKVTPPEASPLKQYCEMYIEGRNVKQMIMDKVLEEQPLTYRKLHTPVKGTKEKVMVTYVESTNRFFVQLDCNKEALNTVMSCVAEHCQRGASQLSRDKLRPGATCCALYPLDQIWYRAQILNVEDDVAMILFVDYGNQDTVSISGLKEIRQDIVTKVRTQALQCCLNGYENGQPDQAISIQLEELTLEKEFTMQIVDVTSNQVPVVNLYDSNQSSISSQLVPVKLTHLNSVPAPVSSPVKAAVNKEMNDEWNEDTVLHQSVIKTDYESRRYGNSEKTKSPSQMERSWSRKGLPKERGVNKRQRGNNGFKKSFDDESRNKPWRSRENGDEKGGRFSRDEKSSWRDKDDRPSREEKSGSWRDKDDNKASWRNKENDDKPKWGQDGENRGNKWGRDKDENYGSRFNKGGEDRGGRFNKDGDEGRFKRDDNSGSGFKPRKFDKDDDNEGRKFGGTRDNDNDERGGGDRFGNRGGKGGGRFGDRGGAGKFDKGDGGAGGDRRKKFESRDGGFKRDSSGFKRNDDRDSFKKPYDRGDTNKTSSYGGKKFSSHVEKKVVTIPQSTVQVGSTELVEIVYSLSPSEFYVQISSDSDKLTTLMSDIAAAFETGTGESMDSPKKGQFCIAKYSEDETWYRGRIESTNTDSADVVFVDYGNHEEVSNHNIKKLTTSLTSLPIQGVKCELFGCMSTEETWTEEEISNFITNCEGKKLKAQFVEKVFSRDSFKVVLIEEDIGVVINSSVDMGYTVPQEEIDKAISKMNLKQFCDVPVQLGNNMRVQLSWYISPSHFYIQPLDYNVEFRAMIEHMQSVAKKGVSKPTRQLKVGDPVIARFKEDKVLYRARVKVDGLDPIVTYVDYGNCAKVEAGMIWELESQYATLPVQAICCALSGIIPPEETWPKAGTSNIDSYFLADEFNCSFIRELEVEGNMYAVQLVNGEKNVADQLVADNLAVEGSIYTVQDLVDDGDVELELALLVGQVFNIVITHVENSSKFYIQLLPSQANVLLQEIEALQEDPKALEAFPADQLVCGALCIAMSEAHYYRCRIVDSTLPLVQFIDYGEVQEVKLEDLYTMPVGNLKKHPALATECTLNLIEPLLQELETQFKETTKLKPYIVYINGVQNETLQVTLYEKNGQSRPYQQQDELSPPTVDSICPLPILNSHQKVIISHAGEDFIYLQKLEFSTVIAELLGKLFEFYNEKEYEEQEWKVGMYCAAKSSAYEQWYRAKISAVESDITVQYIDYGNYETLPLTSLRMLDSSFYDQHYLAFKVSFYVQWLVAVETLLEITEGNVYNAVVLRKNCFEWLAELMSQEGVSLTDSLVELGFVTALEDSPFKRVVEGGRFIEGSDLSVSVSHIDSPSQIWLLIVSDIEVIEELQDRLQVVGDRLKPLSQPSGLFAAKFSDGMWYRAVHISDNIVRFIDYGNSDQVDMSDLKELTSDFTEPAEGYAVKCELFVEPNEGEWNDYSKQKLEELLIDSEEELVAHVLAVKESSVVAELFVRGKSVSEILVEQGLAKIPQKQTTVFVCHINSPSDFFIQHKGSEAELEEIAENMLLAENFEELNDINGTLDNLIAAKYSVDELWYRAKVIEKVEDKITVLFVDYGNCAVVTDIKVLPIEIAAKPCAAKHCSFKLPSGVEYWSETATDLFEELAAGGTTSFNMVLQCQGEPDVVVLFTSDGRSIVEDLKTVCIINENDELAKPETIKNIEEEAPDSRIPVYVTHANSPDDFYIQLETSSTDLEVITDRMIDFDGFTVINSPSEWIGKLVAGKSSSDDLWYRAKVLEHNVSGTSVLFVDYGNNEVISEVRELPEDIIESAFLAKHCALKLPNGVLIWSAAACESFIEIVLDSSVLFEMDILKVGEPNVITLRFDGKQIENVLLELCDIQSGIDIQDSEKDDKIVDDLKEMSAADESPTLMESAGDFFPVFVSHYNSPNDFYIQNEGCEISLQEIASSLMGADSFNDLNTDDQEKLIGELVASQYQFDSLWYRSKILEFHSSEAKVLFVDFGNTAIVTNLKELPRGLKERRTISIQCSLNQPNEIDNWSESACSKFIELTGEGTILLELRILKKCDAVNIVDLYFEGQSVTEELTKLCMPNVNIKMTDLILDSVQHDRDVQRNQIVQEVEQITEDIINEATDRVVEKFVKLEAEALVSRIKEYEGMKSNDEKLQENDLVSDEVKFSTTVDYANTLSRYNNDEHIVPGCGYQSSELKELLETANTVTEQVTEHKTIEDIIPIVETLSETKDRINTLSNSKIDDCASQNTMIDAEDKEKMHSLNCDSENSLINTQLKTIDHTPSRYNIDEHIVPGCVLQSTMDNSEKEKIVQSTDETESNENKSIEKSTVKKLGSLSPVKNINPSEDKNSNGSKLKIVIPNVKESAQSDSKHPKTPNRLNIDEHIVPGCMTHVIPHQQSSPSDH